MSRIELDRLAGEMFQTFSRFEYALKAARFHNGDGDATPNWTAFAQSVPNVFDDPQDDRVSEAVAYILAHPPKKQVVEEGVLEWKDVAPATNLKSDKVLIYVRRVRNNLFHGGKFNGHWFEPQRSKELLEHSLVILRACLEASHDVRAAYDG
jgi:hypothetical protein